MDDLRSRWSHPPPAGEGVESVPAGPAGRVGLPVALVAAAIALAFADASVVALALPDLYGAFGVSIVDVSWVITGYNVAVVAAAVVLLAVRASPRLLTLLGLSVFAAASVVCGVAPSFAVLMAARCVQGVGAACLLVGALPLLAVLTGRARGIVVWGYAAAIGVAVGPALGGLLTELFSWRSIFLVQAPVAVLALAGARAASPRRTEPAGGVAPQGELTVASFAPTATPVPAPAPPPAPAPVPSPSQAAVPDIPGGFEWSTVLADVGYVLLFAALVGALFLSVLLLIVVWAYSPLQGALVVSALAVGTVAVVPLGHRLPAWVAALAGGWLLTGGLLALAWLPAADAGYALAALAFCGCGYGLVNEVLAGASLPWHERHTAAGRGGGDLRRAGNLEVGAKHLGFVIGLAAIAPTLAGALAMATRDAAVAATAVVLDAPLELGVKVPLALDLKELVENTRRGEVPDVRAPFEERADDAEAIAVRDDLTDAIESTITRSFRSSFLIAALVAAAATVVATAVGLAEPRRRGSRSEGET